MHPWRTDPYTRPVRRWMRKCKLKFTPIFDLETKFGVNFFENRHFPNFAFFIVRLSVWVDFPYSNVCEAHGEFIHTFVSIGDG
jgi:hypothetical protein